MKFGRNVIAAVALSAVLLVPTGGSAAAATCTPTGFYRDNINMTARLANPTGAVSGTVDATGCNIGVFYGGGAAGTVSGATISGANYFGVVAYGDLNNVSVDVLNSTITRIGESPLNGTQHGVAVYYRAFGAATATGTISGNKISHYQKGGIVTNGPGTTAVISANTVAGEGPVSYIAQNGIQVGFGAVATVRGNAIAGNFYTGSVGVGPNPGGQNPPGWQYFSAGLLLYRAGRDTFTAQNHFSGNQRNLAVIP